VHRRRRRTCRRSGSHVEFPRTITTKSSHAAVPKGSPPISTTWHGRSRHSWRREQQAVHIHGEVPVDAVRFLAAIPAAGGSGHGVGGGYRLRVDDRRGRAPVPPGPHPRSVAQRVEAALSRSAAGPAGEHRVHRRGWRELHRQLPPRDTTARDVQDGVHYRTAAMLLGSSAAACRAARRSQQRFEDRPLGVGHRPRVHRATMSARRMRRARWAWRDRR
jgi:hypothetical protein